MNPYLILAGVLALVGAFGGGYWRGNVAASDACKAEKLDVVTKVESTEDARDANIEAIATAAATATAAAMNENRGATNESSERIRTIVVPGACRAVDPAILLELRQARDDANAALGVGVRPDAAGADPTDP